MTLIVKDNSEEKCIVSKERYHSKPSRGVSLFCNSEMVSKILENAELLSSADVKVLHLISRTQIPCYWEPKIMAIVPVFTKKVYSCVKNTWTALRNCVRKEICPINKSEPLFENNSATTIDELYNDAIKGARTFKKTCEEVASSSGGRAYFGPSDVNIVKSKESIHSKVLRSQKETECSEKIAIAEITDGVRGTLVFDTPSQLKKGVEQFIKLAKEEGCKVTVCNLWDNEADYGGYLDIDCTIVIPLENGKQVIAELQFHLKDFYDGSKGSIVSRAHKVYEEMRMIPVTGKSQVNLSYEELNETSRLYFTAGLFQAILKK